MKNAKNRTEIASAAVGRLLLRVAPIALVLGLLPVPSHADWLPSSQDERCAAEDVDGISQSVRDAIEASVRRAEAAIAAPLPVGDLSCLNDLMMQPLDVFSHIGGLLGSLQQGLTNAIDNLDIEISGMICSFAAQKWATLTEPLHELDATLGMYASAPADAVSRLASGSLSSGGSSGMFPGVSGVLNLGNSVTEDSSYRGSIENYTLPTTTVSTTTAGIPIFEENEWSNAPADDPAADAALAALERQEQQVMSNYLACKVAQQFDGSHFEGVVGGHMFDGSGNYVLDTPPVNCLAILEGLPAGIPLVTAPASAGVAPSSVPAAVRVQDATDRNGGQARPDMTAPAAPDAAAPSLVAPAAPSTGSVDPVQSIWDRIGQPARTGN
ncbi:hypothetical protein LAZ40_11765 [Cereibacter sphaeroides]|uniref:hypothetical protein n=1 Tax=Cereibacter sphaeroides TaxID=1063 RepID=UPI001F293DD0|nr:hypothetical protein [Cereibacter sphaeroides]MCE6959696.1 hypothetical protein [Cereibacter sphaeroides]MCE6974443.1 hypothetical protein [Cereibacter sphaeroides]